MLSLTSGEHFEKSTNDVRYALDATHHGKETVARATGDFMPDERYQRSKSHQWHDTSDAKEQNLCITQHTYTIPYVKY